MRNGSDLIFFVDFFVYDYICEPIKLNTSRKWICELLIRDIYLLIGLITITTLLYYLINAYSSLRYTSNTDPSKVNRNEVTIVMPVYNEKVEVFEESVESISLQGSRFIVVGDSSLEPYKTIVEKHGGTFILQEVRQGQKKAIVRGVREVTTKYVMLMDSDTVLPPDAVSSMMSHFVENVGGVGANLSIKKTGSPISYASEFVERTREVVFRAMSAHGNVMNLDGACVMYRTDIIKPFILSPEFSDFKFMGKPSPLGEDWLMTGYIIKKGYKAVKDYNTKVQCYPQENVKKFFKQNLRWSRSNWIRFGRELRDGTIVKAGRFYTFEMMYTFMMPFIALGIGLFRLYIFLMYNHGAFQLDDIFTYAIFGDIGHFGSHIIGRIFLTLANIGGSGIFLATVMQRISSEKLKTAGYGAFALAILFVTSIYGFVTFWKGKKWGTR